MLKETNDFDLDYWQTKREYEEWRNKMVVALQIRIDEICDCCQHPDCDRGTDFRTPMDSGCVPLEFIKEVLEKLK